MAENFSMPSPSSVVFPSSSASDEEHRQLLSSASEPATEGIKAVQVTANPTQPQSSTRAAMETLSDGEDAVREGSGAAFRRTPSHTPPSVGPSASAVAVAAASTRAPTDALVGPRSGPLHITAADYADRRRLLNHITYLSTQLQRAQLQVDDLTRALCVVRGFADGGAAADVTPAAETTSAAILSAREEAELHGALQNALAVFDPVIAQTQIYRLDDALAQMGLLREAELDQLQVATASLREHRALVRQLSDEVATLRSRSTTLEQQKERAESQRTAATLELEQLRLEEVRLNQRVAGLQELAQDGTWTNHVRVVGGGGAAHRSVSRSVVLAEVAQLEEAELMARQELLLDIFWCPLLIAFDAGLTWITDSATLRTAADAATTRSPSLAATSTEAQLEAAADDADRLALTQAGVLVAAPTPPTDADLLLLRRQQEEMAQLRARLDLLQERSRVSQLEKERLQFLYENEMRRSERMAQDHVAQLQQAYDELVKDRRHIMSRLKGEVEDQLRLAFEDGRAHEKNAGPTRSRRAQKPLRSSNAVS